MSELKNHLPGTQISGLPEAIAPPQSLYNRFKSGDIGGFCVVAAKITEPGAPALEEQINDDFSDSTIMDGFDLVLKEIISPQHIVDRFIQKELDCWIVEVADSNAIVMENQRLLDNSLLHRAVSLARDRLGVSMQLFVTKMYSRLIEFRLAIEELSLRYDSAQFFNADFDVLAFHYNDSFSLNNRPEDYSEVKLYYEKLFFNYVVAYRFSEACEVFLRIVDLELTSPEAAVSLKTRVPERLRWIMYVLGTPSKEPGTPLKNNVMVSLRRLDAISSIDEMKARIYEIFAIFEEDYCSESAQSQSTFDRVIDFILDNYSDPNLSSTMLCDRFGISPAYLSRLFRKKTAMSMVDFIHSVRLSHLKELLLSSEETLGALAPKCGYVSLWTMSRAFKKYEGITPNEYRLKISG